MLRALLTDFALNNPYYAAASVTVFEVNQNLQQTATVATLYAGPTGATLRPNPIALDSLGKFPGPVYVEKPVIAVVTPVGGAAQALGVMGMISRWRGVWVASRLYYPSERVRDPSGPTTFIVINGHVSNSFAADVAAGLLQEEIDADAMTDALANDILGVVIPIQPAAAFLRINAGGNAIEGRTAAQVRTDVNAVNLAGDTMLGALSLPSTDPVTINHATRKKYVDDLISGHSHTAAAISNFSQAADAQIRVTMGQDWSHNAKYYGVVADDTGIGTPTDNTAAMSAYLQILSNTGMPGFWAGRVYCASNIVWDMGPSWERGASLSGVARQGSRLRFGGGIPANTLGLRIHSTTQPFLPGFLSYDWLGLRLSQIHILANHDGFALGIGRDDLEGPLNVAVFDQVTVFNTYTGFNSGAWWLKHVVNSYFQMCAGNCYGGVAPPHYGTSLRLERVQFTHVAGGSFGNCDIGWQLRDFTNTITADAVDIEAVRVGIQTESSSVGQIRMRGPRLALAYDWCIRLLQGSTSDILSIESLTTDDYSKLVDTNYDTGLLLKDKNGITQPGFAWGTNITNKTYKVVEVTILGGTPTGIVVNGFDFGAQATTRMLNPGDVIRVNGSGAGAWVWRPMQQ